MIIFQKCEKIETYKKLLEFDLKIDNHSIYFRNYAAAYYQTLKDVIGPLVREKIEKTSKTTIKNVKKFQTVFFKLLKFVILKF